MRPVLGGQREFGPEIVLFPIFAAADVYTVIVTALLVAVAGEGHIALEVITTVIICPSVRPVVV